MNLTRLTLAALAALVAYFIVGGIFFAVPALRTEFEKFPAIYRTGDDNKSVMAVGMLGTLLAIIAAAMIFALMHPAGAGIQQGIELGIILAVFHLGSFVLHNHMMLKISTRLSMLQGVVYTLEWIAVGAVISVIYHG